MYRCLLFVSMAVCAGVGCGGKPAPGPDGAANPGDAPRPGPADVVPQPRPTYKPIPEDVLAAWKKAGFISEWIDEETGLVVARPDGRPGVVPGLMYYPGFGPPVVPDRLPPIGVPFALRGPVIGQWPPAPKVARLMADPNLTALSSPVRFNTFFSDDELAKALAAIPGPTAIYLDGSLGAEGRIPLNIRPDILRKLPKFEQLRAFGLRIADNGDDIAAELTKCRGLTALTLWNAGLTDRGAADVAKLSSLTTLNLHWNNVTDVGAKELASLNRLTNLDLSSTRVTAAGLKELSRLPNLTCLSVSKTSADGLEALTGFTSLDTLKLHGPLCMGTDLATLKRLKNLKSLHLSGPMTDEHLEGLAGLSIIELHVDWNDKLTPGALASLANLKNLITLSIRWWDDDLTVAHYQELAKLQGVKSLTVEPSSLTPTGLGELAKMKGLTSLDMPGYADATVKESDVEKLRQALPNCRISGPWLRNRP